MIKNLLSTILFASLAISSFAGPAATSKYILIDQFGYRCSSNKVAVIADPQVGYNASDAFSPSVAANQYEVRKWDTDQVVLTGTLTVWNAGATHAQSGDKGWWFDFSTLQTPGSYYIYDKGQHVGSYKFEIGDGVYNEVLKHAIRSYYYQRVGFAKTTTYAGAKWTDAASHTKDAAAVDLSGNNPKDLSGGWYDAGDYNKYTTFTSGVVPILLEAYRKTPAAFKDDYNIPESGNGVPDILDEVKWEMDWLKRMQDATGNGGLYLKVGSIDYNESTPPSTDNRTRYYYGECTSATITGALDFAIGALVYKNIPTYASYGTDLQTRAISAWNRFKASTSNFTNFQTACDNGTIKSGDADRSADEQKEDAWTAAVYLYELTGDAEYKTYIESNYTTVSPYSNTYWNAYRGQLTTALGKVTEFAGINATVKANIITNLTTDYASSDFYLGAWNANKDLYRAPMPDFAYRWGSNCVKGTAGMISMMKSSLLSSNKQTHRDIAEGFVHYIHGVNPQNLVYISNMNAYGAENSVNEFYHTWFSDGSIWDNVQTSSNGPAPGYVPGGPNYWYVQESGGFSDISPPAGMPHQKAYKEFNTGWDGTRNVASYSITENGIYYQAAFIHLLSSVMENQVCGVTAIKQDQTITFGTLPGKHVGDAPYTLSATASSGLTVTYASSNTSVATVSGNTVTIVGSGTAVITASQAGNATYNAATDVTQTLTVESNTPTNIKNQLSVDAVKIYPNPTKTHTTIEFHGGFDDVKISVYTLDGKPVFTNTYQSVADVSKQIELSSIPSGIYIIEIDTKQGVLTKRLIKE